ncbi:component of the polarisome [Entomortierella chlamydospora]|nr:component of the polarisome [Entomortierella chlamydospora]
MSRQQNGQWQPQQPQRPLHPTTSSSSLSAQNRSTSPQPTSPVSPSMHINTKPSGQQQRSNPTSPNAAGSSGNVMEIAARHYEALQKYLLAHILKEKHGVSEQRIAAREKLSRLLQNQLQDLSTDVYDELRRRTDGLQVPFLAVRDDFHPKRNQARQKLATLPQNRFKDLASDVYVQLERQFPSLIEMFPLQALEEAEYLAQQSPQSQTQPEPTTPVVQQSSVVPNVATFTIQDSSNNDEDDAYYRSPVQPAPPTPSALEGNVNFASLDSLMADLGNIVSKDGTDPLKGISANSNNNNNSNNSAGIKGSDSKDSNDVIRLPSESKSPLNGLGINTGSSGDQTPQEYEIRIAALCKRLQHLESEIGDGINRPEGSRLAQVERLLAKQTDLYNEQTSKLSKLQLEFSKVMNDYHAQLETVDMVNQEVKSLVMENKNLRQRHSDAEEELQLAYNKIKKLEDENSDLKADLEDSRQNQRNIIQEDSVSRAAPISPTSTNNNNNISSINNNNINDNINNNVNNNDNNVKDHGNSHNGDRLSRELDNEPKGNNDWNHDRQQARNSIMVNPGSVVHKESLDSFRNAVDDLLAAGRSDSSSSVLMSMKSVVIACKAVTEDVEDYEHDMGQEDSFTELKQELSSGLTQLVNAAKDHANAFNEDEDEFDRTLGDLENAADQLEAIVMDIVNVPKRIDGSSNSNNNNNNNKNVDDNLGMNKATSGGGNVGGGNDDGPMDALDLKIFLETQTGLIVSSIQTLLTSLRSSADPEDIRDASENIAKVAELVIRETRQTLSSEDAISAPQAIELRNQGEMVLEDLENSLDLFFEMRDQVEQEPELAQSTSTEAKSVKQKLASACFDIAKYTKELVSLIEE